MRCLFLGGKNVGYGILETLLKTEEVVAIFSNPSDLEPNRWYQSVQTLAAKYKIPYHTSNINSADFSLQNIDYLVCAYYDKILSQKAINYATKGSINVHMGLIQEYRGCYPTTFPIIDGVDHAGITMHQMTPVVDDGLVYAQRIVPLTGQDTGRSCYDKCTEAAIDTFKEAWPDILSGKIIPHEVDTFHSEYHARGDFPSHKVNIHWPVNQIDRYVRALTFPPFKKPYIVLGENNMFKLSPI